MLRLDEDELWKLEQTNKMWKNFFEKYHVWTHWLNCELSQDNPCIDWKYFFRSSNYLNTFLQTMVKNEKTELANRNRVKHGIREISKNRSQLLKLGKKANPKVEFKISNQAKLTSCHFDDKRICLGDNKGTIQTYDIQDGSLVDSRKLYDGPVGNVQLIGNDTMLSSGGKNNQKCS